MDPESNISEKRILRIIRLPKVKKKVGLSRSAILARVAKGDIPPPIPLGSGRAVGWIESEIDEWLEQRIADAKTAAANKPKKS